MIILSLHTPKFQISQYLSLSLNLIELDFCRRYLFHCMKFHLWIYHLGKNFYKYSIMNSIKMSYKNERHFQICLPCFSVLLMCWKILIKYWRCGWGFLYFYNSLPHSSYKNNFFSNNIVSWWEHKVNQLKQSYDKYLEK